MEKKTEHIGFRFTKEDKKRFDKMADYMGLPTGNLASAIVIQYMRAFEEHGKDLIWPPEFNYRIDAPTLQSEKLKKKKK